MPNIVTVEYVTNAIFVNTERDDLADSYRTIAMESDDDIVVDSIKVNVYSEDEYVTVKAEEFNRLLNESRIEVSVNIFNGDVHDKEDDAFEVTMALDPEA